MPNPTQPEEVDIDFEPIHGVNSTDNELRLDQYEASSGTLNMLFEGKEAFTRPGESFVAMTTNAAATWWAQGIDVNAANYVLMVVGSGPARVWYLSTGGNTEITGPGTNFNSSPVDDFTAAAVNGVVLIGGSSAGALRWDPSGNVYTVLATAPWKYVVSHLSRAFGAFNLNVAGTGQRTVGWSVAGDETTWTGSTNGSGSSIIADAFDQITGLGVIHDVVCIFRQHGIHLAMPTGLAFPAYSIRTWKRDARGCAYPLSLAVSDNIAYYMSYSDVWRFDLIQERPVGYKIRKQLFAALNNNLSLQYKGVIVHSQAFTAQHTIPRTWYILVPIWGSQSGTGAANIAPIFLYDELDDQWSVHDFAESVNTTASDPRTFSNGGEQGFVLFDTASPTNYRAWRRNTACERNAILNTAVKVAGNDPSSEYLANRLLVRTRDNGNFNVTATVTCRGAFTPQSFSSPATPVGTNNNGLWASKWFDLRQNAAQGQYYQVSLAIPAGNQFNTDFLRLKLTRSGDFRG